MPIEVRRFGVGNRRPGGPPGSEGVSGQVIHSDARGIVSELAFERGGRIFRVHDVAPNRDALTIAEAIEGAA